MRLLWEEKGESVTYTKEEGNRSFCWSWTDYFWPWLCVLFPRNTDFYVRKDYFWIIYYLFIYHSIFRASYDRRSVTCVVNKWSWWELREGKMLRAHCRAGSSLQWDGTPGWPPSSPCCCSCSKWMIRLRESWLLLFIHHLCDEIPDPISLSSSQHFTSPSSKWQCVLCSSKLSAVAHHSNNSQPLRLLLLFVGRRPGERWEEITQHHFPSLAYRETGESWEPEFSYVTCPSQQTLNGSM